jgi:lipopolysaccharide export system permease protein
LFTKIDRYILKSFLIAFFFVLLLVLTIVTVVDFSERADDFAKSNLPLKKIWLDYYAGLIPSIVSLVFPLIVLITVIFFVSKMANRTEVVALFATGMSLARFLRPFLLGGIILAIILYLSVGYQVPKNAGKMLSFKAKYLDPNSGGQKEFVDHINHYFKIDSNSYAGILSYDTTTKSSYSFFVNSFKGATLVKNLRSDIIRWDTAKKKWHLENVVVRLLNDKGEVTSRYTIKDTLFNFKPNNLILDEYTKQKLTNPELNDFIKQEKARLSPLVKDLVLERYKRITGPLSVILLTLMGAIIASKKIRGGSGLHLVTGLVYGALLILADRFSTVFAVKGNLPPLIASLIPLTVFGLYTYYLYRKAPK